MARRRGAATLLAVLLIGAFMAAALAAAYTDRAAERRRAIDRAAGAVFAHWMLSAHRATLTQDYTTALGLNPSFTLTPAALRGYTPGVVEPSLPDVLPEGSTLTVGVMDDGTTTAPAAPVAMAFAVVEPVGSGVFNSIRLGALAAGLSQVAGAGASTAMDVHRTLIETALGRSLAADAMWVTADHGIPYVEGALHRGRQPGRPDLSSMRGGIDMNGQDVLNAGVVRAASVTTAAGITAGGDVAVDGGAAAALLEVTAGDVLAPGQEAEAAGGTFSTRMTVGRGVAGTELRSPAFDVTNLLAAASAAVTGQLDADVFAAPAMTLTGAATGAEIRVGDLDITGTLTASSSITVGGMYAPSATFSGAITTGSCSGC